MLPDRVSNPGPLTYESGALPMSNYDRFQEDKCAFNQFLYCYYYHAYYLVCKASHILNTKKV